MSMSDVQRRVDEAYAATRARLADDPEYQKLVTDAEFEADDTPGLYFARNKLALHVEIHTPMPFAPRR